MILISVLIPLFNKEPYIKRCLDSIFSQTFQNFEVIIVNDGSTDKGPKIVATYSDQRIRIINQENFGPGAARNRGIKEARGKYIAFIDADDEWLPDFLYTSFNILEKYLECDICISAWYQDYLDGCKIDGGIDITKAYKDNNIVVNTGIITVNKESIKNGLFYLWCSSTVLIRRSIFENGYKFYSESKHLFGEDFYLWVQLAFNHTFYRNCQPLAWYHNGTSGLSTDSKQKNELEAFLISPEYIIKKTKNCNRKMLKFWLSRYALQTAHSRLGIGQIDNAVKLIKNFPAMFKVSLFSFIFLILKLILFRIGFYVHKY